MGVKFSTFSDRLWCFCPNLEGLLQAEVPMLHLTITGFSLDSVTDTSGVVGTHTLDSQALTEADFSFSEADYRLL